MPSQNPNEQTAIMEQTEQNVEKQWNVILFNDEFHSFDEVILQLQKATGCSLEAAESIATEAHNEGQAVAYTETHIKCEHVALILKQIDLIVAVEPSE